MNELVLKNANLGLTMHKVNWNGEDVVWGDDMRDALRWGRTVDMVRELKEEKEFYKVKVSDLKSMGYLNFCEFAKVKHNTLYAYLITRQGVARLIATRRPHDIKDNPELAAWLDKLQDWIFGEVLPEVLSTGCYLGKPLVAGQHAIDGVPKNIGEALRMMADEYDAHELTINAMHNVQEHVGVLQGELDEAKRTKAWISTSREASALGQLGVLTNKIKQIQNELERLKAIAQKYIDWCEGIRRGKGKLRDNSRQLFIIDDRGEAAK